MRLVIAAAGMAVERAKEAMEMSMVVQRKAQPVGSAGVRRHSGSRPRAGDSQRKDAIMRPWLSTPGGPIATILVKYSVW
jgi:hypothetical protein